MAKKGGRRKKTRTHVAPQPNAPGVPAAEKVPRSLVIRQGRTTREVLELVHELRRVMSPNTAMRLKERRTSKMKDYTAVAGQLGLTHILAFSQNSESLSLRLARFPQGPTLSFKVERYCLQAHVKATQKRPFESTAAYLTPPLVVLNNFNDAYGAHVKLMKITFQHMLPALNVATVKLMDCRRIVLFNYDKATGNVEVRHYAIRAAPLGLSRSVRRLVQTKVPDLSKMEDISEYVLGSAAMAGGAASDSEMEDEGSHVVLPDKYRGRGNLKAQRSAIKLSELGPRMTLKLKKVERGFLEGDVIYHEYIHRTPEEVRALETKVKAAKELKKRRREEQERNVARKKQARGAEEEGGEEADEEDEADDDDDEEMEEDGDE